MVARSRSKCIRFEKRRVVALSYRSPGYGCVAAHREPQDAVERVLVGLVLLVEVQLQRLLRELLRLARRASRPACSSRRAGSRFFTAVYGVRSGLSVKQPRIGVADRSSWFIGGRPRISSIVLTMPGLVVAGRVDGLPLRVRARSPAPTVRWPSTWSKPFCGSSSIDEDARLRPELALRLTASTTMPSARSLSATIARGVGESGPRAVGVVARQEQVHQVRELALLLELLQLVDEQLRPVDVRAS